MPDWLATLLLVSARVFALVSLIPGMDGRFVPWRVRLALAWVLTVAVLCVVPCCEPVSLGRLAPLLVQEASVGLSLALVPAALIFGLQLATESLLGMTGLATDESSGPVPGSTISRFFLIVTLSVFFAASGHRYVFQALLDSFYWMPVGSAAALPTTKEVMLEVLQYSFQMGIRVVTPIAASLGIGILALAAINRVVAQLGYFAVGMSIQTTIFLTSVVIFMGSVGLLLEFGFETNLDTWRDAWSGTFGVVP